MYHPGRVGIEGRLEWAVHTWLTHQRGTRARTRHAGTDVEPGRGELTRGGHGRGRGTWRRVPTVHVSGTRGSTDSRARHSRGRRRLRFLQGPRINQKDRMQTPT
eukprot:5323535-Prymnesium_polylepis.2